MKKRIFACMAAAMLVSASSVPVNAESTMIFDSDNKSLQMDGIVAVADYQGAAAALLEFTYTNKTSEGKAPMYEYFPTIYQDGVSLSSTVLIDPNYVALCNNSLTQVKDGASISYAVAYKLIDLESDLEIEIKDAIAGGNVQTFTIPIENSGEPVETEVVDWEAKYNELLLKYEELEGAYNALLSEVKK